MKSFESLAWVLHAGNENEKVKPAKEMLQQEEFIVPNMEDTDVIVAPIYGSWEGNMAHAVERKPIDICHFRREPKVVIGNAGVVKVLTKGSKVTHLQEGEYAIVAPVNYTAEGVIPDNDFPQAYAYDAKNSIGLLAKKTKMPGHMLFPIPKNTKYSLQQWAAFSLRYLTAWTNWEYAYKVKVMQDHNKKNSETYVWAWGGGVALAELSLANHFDCKTFMLASKDNRLNHIKNKGIVPIDRREFPDLNFNDKEYKTNPTYAESYKMSEKKFLKLVNELTNGLGVSIFIDNIGSPIWRATSQSLGNYSVIATCGWKHGANIMVNRAMTCIKRNIHINTHGVDYSHVPTAINFAEKNGWIPEINEKIYQWEEIPQLAEDYAHDKLDTYFGMYQVNPE